MSRAKRRPLTASRKAKAKTSVPAGARRSKSKIPKRTPTRSPTKRAGSAGSKQARIVASLQSPAGVTIDSIAKATGWQQHSVRGFLAGVVRKKLGLDLVSETSDAGRVYRIQTRETSADKT